jgi:hypothetical protein
MVYIGEVPCRQENGARGRREKLLLEGPPSLQGPCIVEALGRKAP